MKKLFLLIVISAAFVACKKTKQPEPEPIKQSYRVIVESSSNPMGKLTQVDVSISGVQIKRDVYHNSGYRLDTVLTFVWPAEIRYRITDAAYNGYDAYELDWDGTISLQIIDGLGQPIVSEIGRKKMVYNY